ncbi:agmatine deiminase family protein [Rubellicoccus peritrichatus]|uniref:Agmatine deiminase family protein n=1 Tax=Rubellicoccus peritrichatus TaxID=3080537 RepID=A0AAQ3LDH4_9BACT|nr:agmatine deiminase family protein [Puniceicoccus sp. CR14]WOO41875.1 agmatine deiminase family protein [Puniceicoccus sp. CR14]
MIVKKLTDFRVPAEWEPQEAVWLSWPVSDHIWPSARQEIWKCFATLAALMARYQRVRINADPAAHNLILQQLKEAKADLDEIELYPHTTDDVWCRDHGPVWLKNTNTGEVAISDWKFNAWGGKFEPYKRDDQVPQSMAKSLDLHAFPRKEVLEGGAIEVNGEGVLLTTEIVMLNRNRGGRVRADWKQALGNALNIKDILWLGEGLPNDDTDGHIDNIARFFQPNGVLTVESNGDEELKANARRLMARFRDVVHLPLPEVTINGQLVPASYANFVILNGAVIVPTFGVSQDEKALDIIKTAFPGRKVAGFGSRLLLEEGGAVHCLTSNQPQ